MAPNIASACAAFLTLVSISTPVRAGTVPAVPRNGDRVSFCGTVVNLVEGNCLGVKSGRPDQPLYNISVLSPKPAMGTLIAGSGVVGGMSFCMQGINLASGTWKKVDVCTLGGKGNR